MWKLILVYCLVAAQIRTIYCDDRCAIARQKQIAMRIDPTQPSAEYSIQMCNAARSGLPKCSRCQNIAIVGAGVSGLTAGIELANAGHRVVIYEASNRTGGRILTHREPGRNFLTELGAMRLPLDEHALLQIYIDQRFNLTTAPFISSDPDAYVFLNNVRQTVRQTETNPNAFGFDLKPDESTLTADQLWNRATKPLIDQIDKDGQDAFIKQWGSYSVEQYLISYGMSRAAISYVGLMLNIETNLYTALTESIADMKIINDDTVFYHIVGGNDLLTNALRDECLAISDLHCTIVYDSRIATVELSKSPPYDVSMTFVTSGSVTPIQTPRYGSVIVATTATAAQTIQFQSRDLFKDTYRALQQAHYDCASKVALFFNESWWRKEQITGGHSTTDLPIRFTYYHNFGRQDVSEAAIIASYTWSQDSILWQSMPDDIAFKLALENLHTVHITDPKPYFIGGKTQHWCNDPYSHGAFVLFTPYQEFYVKDVLKRSVRNVHFIGEHTSSAHAWIEGGILSALRAALVIQEEYFDVAIIGGGPIGLATAINLANRNSSLRIVVVDQSQIGNSEGSSGSSDTRQFRQMYDEQYLGELAVLSSQLWAQLEIDAGLSKGTLLNTDQGYLFFGDEQQIATTEGDLKDLEQSCKTLSLNCQLLNSTDLQRRYPFFNIPSAYVGIFHQNSGYINVTALMNALEKLALQKNIMIRTGETFLGLDQSIPETASYVRLFTDRGSLNATKVIFTPGPYARNVSEQLGFNLHTTLWELPTIYFPLRIVNATVPTWFAFAGDKQSLYYGFPPESSDRPGYMKISPDFISDMSNPLAYPNNRKNIPDQQLIDQTVSWVRSHIQLVDADLYQVAPKTCLATFLPDNGFLIDYLPKGVRYHDKMIMCAAGWSMKFVTVWADVLAELVVHAQASKYARYMPNFSFDRADRWNPPPKSVSHAVTTDRMLHLFPMISIILMIMRFAN